MDTARPLPAQPPDDGSRFASRGLTLSRRRRRPSGKAPPLPRELGTSGKIWIVLILLVGAFILVVLGVFQLGGSFEGPENDFLRWLVGFRSSGLTRAALWVNGLAGGEFNRVVRWGTVLSLVFFRRWRHLLVFVVVVISVAWLTSKVGLYVFRPRPLGVRIIGSWEGSAFPSRPIAALSVTLLGIVYTLVIPGRPRQRAKWLAGAMVIAVSLARVYLALDHPLDLVFGLILGVGVSVLAYRVFTPNAIFPVAYRGGRAAHLDVGGRRGEAIRQAMNDQLGLTVLDIKPFGLKGSGGSTPLRVLVEGEPDRHVFAKLYAKTHLRADRWYKLGRTILYGTLEDEKAYNSVRRLVQYEDYVLRVMHGAGIPSAQSFGFVEITPEREYLLVTEFLEGGTEITEAEVDDGVIDDALATVRLMWDAGLAHRDIKPANILVRDGKIVMIDLAFGEIRPSPWRQAVDLANMMVVLALRTDADRVYRRSLAYFSADEVAEAFAATRRITMPSQSRALVRQRSKAGENVVARFRELAPARRPIAIQRWSVQRVALTVGVLGAALIMLGILVDNLGSGAL